MADNTKLVQCKIDLKAGTVDVSAPPEDFEKAVEKAKDLAASLAHHAMVSPPPPPVHDAGRTDSVASNRPKPVQAGSTATRKRSGSSASTGRTGRIGSFEPCDLGLSEDAERALLKHYADKKPVEQQDKVATAMYKGAELLGRQSFTYNEIYTLLRLSGEKELPKALDVVIGRMTGANWTVREGNGYALKFPARDYVEQMLPQS